MLNLGDSLTFFIIVFFAKENLKIFNNVAFYALDFQTYVSNTILLLRGTKW